MNEAAKSTADHISDCEEEIVEFENITVKFSISDSQVVAQIYPNCMTIGEVKTDIARKFEIDPKLLSVVQLGKVLKDDVRLYEMERNEFGIYEVCLFTCDPDKDGNFPTLNIDTYYNKSRLPDFITVHIAAEDSSDGKSKDIVVEIQNQAIVKPFVGGYKDAATGTEYHDAFTLTGRNFDKFKTGQLLTRICQTKELKEKLIDTTVDESTQLFGDATKFIYVAAATDFVIVPKKYETVAQRERRENKLKKIILIQKNFRRFLWMRYMKNCAAEYRHIVANRAEVNRKIKENEEKKRLYRENAAKNLPRTKEDFGLLHNQVQLWKQAELRRISAMYSGAARLAEVNILLDKEIQLLNGIERQHIIVSKAVKEYREQQLLKKLGEPIKWVGYNDLIIEMDLLRTQRVRFLSEVLKDLKEDWPRDQRIELLDKVKLLLDNEPDFPHLAEIHDLIDREKNLLIYTRHYDVGILRQRLLMIFVDLIKFAKGAMLEKVETRMCDCCKIVKPISAFALLTRQSAVDTCLICHSIKTSSSDNTVYKAILRSIQRDERKHRALSSYAFILREEDIRYIIDQIWHRHSVLSKQKDINYLRLPRWIKSEDWSPWNCICLTETEARNHNNLKTELTKIYNKKMMLDITNRHLLAKNAFKKLQDVENEFVECGKWWSVGVAEKVL